MPDGVFIYLVSYFFVYLLAHLLNHLLKHAAVMQGQDQIVSMGDTGVDVNHCFFTDTSVSFPGSKRTDGESVDYYLNMAARKILYYRGLADFVDAEGHGTHCAGSMIGAQSGVCLPPWCHFSRMLPYLKMRLHSHGEGTLESCPVVLMSL